MKTKFILLILTLSILAGCNQDDDGNNGNNLNNPQLANATSQICPEISGPNAVHWDVLHGIPVTQFSQIPVIQDLGGFFAHSAFPGLGFSFPTGYSAAEIDPGQSNLVGANVIRSDNRAIWRMITGVTLNGNIPASDIIDNEINALFDFLGVVGTNATLICSENEDGPNGIGQLSFSSRLIQFGEFTTQATVRVQFVPELNSSFVSTFLVSAPTTEFDATTLSTFLPIYFQLLVVDEDARDSDLDGTPDNQDNFPFDPTRQ